MSIRFATSQRNAMRPLAFQGIRATDCHEQLRSFLARHEDFLASRGMPGAAGFLAEPVHGQDGSIDWYSDAAETPVPLSSLPPERRKAAERRLAACAAALGDLMRECEGRRDSGGMAVPLLREALRHPSADDVYVAGGMPILVNWGFASGAREAEEVGIVRLGAAPRPRPEPPKPEPPAETPPPPAPPAPPVPRRGRPGCLSWLLPLLLALLALWLLLSALGALPSPLPAGCFRQDVQADGEILRSGALDDEEGDLLRRLGERAAMCVPEAPEEEPAAEREPILPEEPKAEEPREEPRAEEPKPLAPEEMPFFADAPAEEPPPPPEEPKPRPKRKAEAKPEKKPQPKPEKKPQAKAERTPPKSGSRMEVPEDAAGRNDLSFLEGCWRSVTGLQNTYGQEVEAVYCFDARGQGSRYVNERRGMTCSGPSRARFQGNRLLIEGSSAPCPNGSRYVPQDIGCTGTGSSTRCNGKEHTNVLSGGLSGLMRGLLGGNTWEATFIRK